MEKVERTQIKFHDRSLVPYQVGFGEVERKNERGGRVKREIRKKKINFRI